MIKMNATTISDLPPEMILELFKRLDAISLVACSSVNKLWHSICSGFKLDRLVIIADPEKCPLKWRYSLQEKKIEDHELCIPKLFPRLAKQPMLSNLKYLAMLDHTLKFDLKLLNKFTQLVYLQLSIDSGFLYPENPDLNPRAPLRNFGRRSRNLVQNFFQLGRIANVEQPANLEQPGNVRRIANVQQPANLAQPANVEQQLANLAARRANLEQLVDVARDANVAPPANVQQPANLAQPANVEQQLANLAARRANLEQLAIAARLRNLRRLANVGQPGNVVRLPNIEQPANVAPPANVEQRLANLAAHRANIEQLVNVARGANVAPPANVGQPANLEQPANVAPPANVAQPGNFEFEPFEFEPFFDDLFERQLPPNSMTLKLPKLKVFAYTELNYRPYVLSIDCPELSVLAVYQNAGPLLRVRHPETILTLYTDRSLSSIFKFKNLECLVTDRLELMCIDTLQSLPKLQELRCEVNFEQAYSAERREMDHMKRTWRRFLDMANRSRRDFRLVFAGLRLTETSIVEFKLREYRKHGEVVVPDEYLYMMNYEMIDPKPNLMHVGQLDYHLLSGLINEIPACFSQKFAYVQRVDVIGAVHDPDHLQSFLKALRRSLRKLRMDLPNLSQEFYNKLPELADFLIKLELRENKEKQFNFDFISKLQRLSSLTVEQPLLFEPFRSLIRCSAGLVEGGFCLELNKKWFFIWKAKDCKNWKIGENNYCRVVCETERSDEILQYFARLQGEEPMVF